MLILFFRGVVGRINKELISIFAVSFSVLKDMILVRDKVPISRHCFCRLPLARRKSQSSLVFWSVGKSPNTTGEVIKTSAVSDQVPALH